MSSQLSPLGPLPDAGRATVTWFAGWWRIIHFGALILVLALSPSSYSRSNRSSLARHVYEDTAPMLLWFVVLSSLISLVIIRIVVVTAVSYGLSQYALEMVVRVLVLELIPLTAAVFAALRCALPNAAEISDLRERGLYDAHAQHGVDADALQDLPAQTPGPHAKTLEIVKAANLLAEPATRLRPSGAGEKRHYAVTLVCFVPQLLASAKAQPGGMLMGRQPERYVPEEAEACIPSCREMRSGMRQLCSPV